MVVPIKIETEVIPPVWDRTTGRVVRPGGAGKKICIILSDDEGDEPQPPAQPFRREPTIKAEAEAEAEQEQEQEGSSGRGRSPTADVKSEDEDESVSRTLTPGSHQAPHAQAGTIRRQSHHEAASPRTPSRLPRHQAFSLEDRLSDSPGSGGSQSSSDSRSSSSSNDSGAESDSSLDEPSEFRPSRSPSRFAESTPPTTRSRKYAHPGGGEDAPTPGPLRLPTLATPQDTSVSSIPSMSFYIPIRVADRQSGSSSRPQPTQLPVLPSPSGSRVHGWKPINRGQTAPQARPSTSGGQPHFRRRSRSKSHRSSAQNQSTSSSAPIPNTARVESVPRYGMEATAAPGSSVQVPAEDRSPSARSASKGKSKAEADKVDNAEPVDSTDVIQSDENSKGEGEAENKHSRSKKKSRKDKKERRERKEKKKRERREKTKEKEQADEADEDDDDERQNTHHKRHGPSRLARIERTIEETPELQLQPSTPSSSNQNTIPSSPAGFKPRMSTSSPIPPATPGPSRPPLSEAAMKAPERYPTPMASSPFQQSLKRTRSDFEEASPPIVDLASVVCRQRYARMEEELRKERAERERLDERAGVLEGRLRLMQGRSDSAAARINSTMARVHETEQICVELKQQFMRLQNKHDTMHMRLQHQELASNGSSQPRLQPHNEAVISDALVRPRPHGAPPNYSQRAAGGRNPFQSVRSVGQSSSSAGPRQPNEGAPYQNSSNGSRPSPQREPSPRPPSPEPRASPPVQPISPPHTTLPPHTQQEMKHLVMNCPLSELDFSILYDKERDRDQTTAATAFLLNVPHSIIFNRFTDFMARSDFAFDLEHRDAHHKGCWLVRGRTANDLQFKLYHKGCNHSYALSRLAVRLWHDAESVLRLLLTKNHEAVRICHNVCCFNPEHIVVESRAECSDRRSCKREGQCSGHLVWSKCERGEDRAKCILP